MDTVDWVFVGYFTFVTMLLFWKIFISTTDLDISSWFYDTSETEMGEYDSSGGGTVTAETTTRESSPSAFTSCSTFSGNRKTADDQEEFLQLHLPPSDVVGGEHGFPIEGMRSGGFIPLPYSKNQGTVTNEDSTMNL
jgi:hypothetical protein